MEFVGSCGRFSFGLCVLMPMEEQQLYCQRLSGEVGEKWAAAQRRDHLEELQKRVSCTNVGCSCSYIRSGSVEVSSI
jgi:hypothetical protein